jgi:hypothetical protein
VRVKRERAERPRTLAGVVAFALVAYLPYRHLMERMDYYERKVDRLEQDILKRRLWMTKDHP